MSTAPFPTSREEQDRYSQLLQQLDLALDLGCPVGVVAKAVNENLEREKIREPQVPFSTSHSTPLPNLQQYNH